jgi:hypothetical protein
MLVALAWRRFVVSLWLCKDQRSNEVVALQNALNVRLKAPQPLAVDGIFGPHTEAALREFQKCDGLKPDGVAGPKTLGALFVRRTVVNRFLITALSSPPLYAQPDNGRAFAGRVGSPYDPPTRPVMPPDIWMPSHEEQVRAWLDHPMPKPKIPTAPAPGTDKPVKTQPSPSRHGSSRLSLTGDRPRVFRLLAPNEWAEFEGSFELGRAQGTELEVVTMFTAAFVKAAPWVKPSASFFVTPKGDIGVRGSVQVFDKPIYEHEWKNTAYPEYGSIKLGIAPYLVSSVMWNYGNKYPGLSIFGAMRITVEAKTEVHNRRGRAWSVAMFAGLAAGGLIAGGEVEKGVFKGKFRMHPFAVQGILQLGLRFGLGNRH